MDHTRNRRPAPSRMFADVRAMAPVAGMPPKITEPILAIPCPISSQFDRWRCPVIPSATRAESSDSIAPNNAIAIASGKISWIWSRLVLGIHGTGSEAGILAKTRTYRLDGKTRCVGNDRRNSHSDDHPGDFGVDPPNCEYQRQRPDEIRNAQGFIVGA